MLSIERFKTFVSKERLFEPPQKVLLAVSGGKDSVLMAHLFKLSGFDFGIAHCNFNLRAEESLRDEYFVRMLALNLGVSFHLQHFDTKEYALKNKVSTQMAARDLRYTWFEQVRAEQGYAVIAVAQHQNDAMETVLLNLTRGTGISGLHGILPLRGKIVRPLLFLNAIEIENWLLELDASFVEDSSNSSDDYARNKIRHQVIPQLKALNPQLEHTFAQNIRRFAEVEQVLNQSISLYREALLRIENGCVYLEIAAVKVLKPQRLLLFEMLKPYNFTEVTVQDILNSLDKQSGTSFYSITHGLTIDRTDLIIKPLPETNYAVNLMIHPSTQAVVFRNKQVIISYSDAVYFEREQAMAFVDFDLLIFPLILRSRQDGDVFMPIGMKNFKKVSNFLVDEKVPLPQKSEVPLLINGNGDLIWIGGMRQDNRYKVTATTKKVAIFELKNSIDG